jgi:hypothetical protein
VDFIWCKIKKGEGMGRIREFIEDNERLDKKINITPARTRFKFIAKIVLKSTVVALFCCMIPTVIVFIAATLNTRYGYRLPFMPIIVAAVIFSALISNMVLARFFSPKKLIRMLDEVGNHA